MTSPALPVEAAFAKHGALALIAASTVAAWDYLHTITIVFEKMELFIYQKPSE
jgi:hypothetical protein